MLWILSSAINYFDKKNSTKVFCSFWRKVSLNDFHDEQKEKVRTIRPSLDHFLLRFWALLLLLVSRQLWSCCSRQLIHASAEYPTTEQRGPLAQRHTTRPSSRAHCRVRERTLKFSDYGKTEHRAWFLQLGFLREFPDSSQFQTTLVISRPGFLIVNPSVLPGRTVLLCLGDLQRLLVSFSPNRSKKVTCCVDSFFLKKTQSIWLNPGLSCSTSGIFNCGRSLSCGT